MPVYPVRVLRRPDVQCVDCGSHTAELSFRNEDERMDAARRVARNWNIGKVIYPGPGD